MRKTTLAFHFVRFGALAMVAAASLFVAAVFALLPGERMGAMLPAISATAS